MQRALAALARVTICGAVRFVDGPHRPAVTADDVSQVGAHLIQRWFSVVPTDTLTARI